MSTLDPTYISMSQRVLDAATQLDKRLRDEGAPLDKVAALVDLLSEPELRGDLLFQHDLWIAIRKLGGRPSTVDQLNVAVDKELTVLRSSSDGGRVATKMGLEFCLALHEVVLRGCSRADQRQRAIEGLAA